MNLRNNIRDFSKIIRTGLSNPSSRIAAGENLDFWTAYEEGRVPKGECEYFYLRNPLVFSGINLNSHAYLGRGYYIDDPDSPEGRVCNDILETSSFKPSILAAGAQVLTYGDGFMENNWSDNGERIESFHIIDGKTMSPKWDEHGVIKYFVQTVGGTQVKFKPTQISFLRFWRLGDQMRGVGFVEPLKDILEIEMDMMMSIRDAVKRFSLPFFHIIKEGADDDEIIDLEEKFKGINRKTFFATSEIYNIKVISMFERFPNLTPQFDLIINKVCSGLRVPKPILLSAGEAVNRATLEALIDFNQYEISLVQEKLTQIIEEQVFKPACKQAGLNKVADLKWHPLMTEDEEQQARIIDYFSKSFPPLIENGLLTEEEARLFLSRYISKR